MTLPIDASRRRGMRHAPHGARRRHAVPPRSGRVAASPLAAPPPPRRIAHLAIGCALALLCASVVTVALLPYGGSLESLP